MEQERGLVDKVALQVQQADRTFCARCYSLLCCETDAFL